MITSRRARLVASLTLAASALAAARAEDGPSDGQGATRFDLSGLWTIPTALAHATDPPGCMRFAGRRTHVDADLYDVRLIFSEKETLHVVDRSARFDGVTLVLTEAATPSAPVTTATPAGPVAAIQSAKGHGAPALALSARYALGHEGSFDELALTGRPTLPVVPYRVQRLIDPDILCPAEWEPADEVLWAYQDCDFGIETIYRAAVHATEANGETVRHRFYVRPADREQLEAVLGPEHVAAEHLAITEFDFESVWMRDCGPIVLKHKVSGARVVADLGDNGLGDRSGVHDDIIPKHYAHLRKWEYRNLNEVALAGGNFMTDGRGRAFLANSVLENPENESEDKVETFLNQLGIREVVYFERMPRHASRHATDPVDPGHIDMYAKLLDAETVLVSDCDDDPGAKAVLDRDARRFDALGYHVIRLLEANSKKLETYTNSLLIGHVALVPTYQANERDEAALAVYRKLGWRAVGIDARAIVQHNGAIHCLSMQVPR
jgi:agmatine/peptidylarginine deiminase